MGIVQWWEILLNYITICSEIERGFLISAFPCFGPLIRNISVKTFCATVGLAVESKNIVGYTQVDLTGKQYNCIAPGFATAGADDTFQMKDIQPSAFNEASDTVQLLNNTQARTIKTYFFYEGAWYEDTEMWNDADEDTFDVMQGFLGNFAAKDVAFMSTGSVLVDPSKLDCATEKLQ